ncbi:hypothetical protein DY000_02044225 [Brassica cretica]|uniref:Uncharacterized protein n=1 Tax=Brassica cretica TaxID=69181 RepID=A0ABQ7ETE0_BRACR|nr:hypothetical protein DY000_02044225 [Brassica cretica]
MSRVRGVSTVRQQQQQQRISTDTSHTSYLNCPSNNSKHYYFLLWQSSVFRFQLTTLAFCTLWQVSIQTSSTCDSFGSSYPRIDQTTDMQESPCSTIESATVTQEVRKALGTNDIDTSEKKMNPYDDDAQGSEFCQEIVIKMVSFTGWYKDSPRKSSYVLVSQ